MILKKKVLVGVCLGLLLLGVVLCGAAVWTLPEPIGSDTAKQKR